MIGVVVRGALSGSLGWGCIVGPICVVERALSVCTGRTVFFTHRVKVGLLELLSHRAFAAVVVGRRRLRGYCQDDIVRSHERWRKSCSSKGIVDIKEICRAKQRRITRSKRTSVVHFQLLCFQSFEVVSETAQLCGGFEAMRPSNDDIPPAEEFCSREAEAMASRPKDKLVKDIGCSSYPVEIELGGASNRLTITADKQIGSIGTSRIDEEWKIWNFATLRREEQEDGRGKR